MNWTIVVCGVIKKDDKVLCCQRSKKMSLPLQWEFPGGKCEKGEDLKSALARELQEELNLNVLVGDLFEVSLYEPGEIKLMAYHCEALNINDLKLFEHVAFKWLNKNELHTLNWAQADLPIVVKIKSE